MPIKIELIDANLQIWSQRTAEFAPGDSFAGNRSITATVCKPRDIELSAHHMLFLPYVMYAISS